MNIKIKINLKYQVINKIKKMILEFIFTILNIVKKYCENLLFQKNLNFIYYYNIFIDENIFLDILFVSSTPLYKLDMFKWK